MREIVSMLGWLINLYIWFVFCVSLPNETKLLLYIIYSSLGLMQAQFENTHICLMVNRNLTIMYWQLVESGTKLLVTFYSEFHLL